MGWRLERGMVGSGRAVAGMSMPRRLGKSGMLRMVLRLKSVQVRRLRISHQKCVCLPFPW